MPIQTVFHRRGYATDEAEADFADVPPWLLPFETSDRCGSHGFVVGWVDKDEGAAVSMMAVLVESDGPVEGHVDAPEIVQVQLLRGFVPQRVQIEPGDDIRGLHHRGAVPMNSEPAGATP